MIRALAGTALATSSLVLACDLGPDITFGPPGFPGAVGTRLDAGIPRERPDTCDLLEEGDSCSYTESDRCERKEHANPACNDGLRCTGSSWQSWPADRSACASDCPSEYVADRPDACAVPNAGTLICEYPEGTCGCAPIRPVEPDAGDGGDGDGGSEPTEDAGDSDGGDAGAGAVVYEWKCVAPEAGCPRTRPVIGSDCVRPMSCDYGDCLFEDGVRMRCYSGTWISEKRCDR